ncbi:O-antigen ligase family protein [Rickettsia endosymbiont of Ceutorhynchus obstrictus]|uniref:O-antigen ligase family protein n=1 Tax=unclassified Rickettsia TaxID=114295 RepID=UPI00397E6E96
MHYYLISGLIFLIPVIGMIGGLSVAATIPILLMIFLFSIKDRITLRFLFSTYKTELLFASWCLLSCIFAINPINSLLTFLQVFSVLLLGFTTSNYIDTSIFFQNDRNIKCYLISGVIVAIILFFIEYLTNGLLTKAFRAIFQSSSSQFFNLYMLDRGCALLSITAWIIITILIYYKKPIISLLFYVLVLYLLFISDSLASFLGFLIGGLTFSVSKITQKILTGEIFFRLISIGLIAGSLSIPIIAGNINPRYISEKYASSIQESAQHRLFIWHFVANKIAEKPIFGYGFASSKYIEVKDSEIIKHNGIEWHPLPLHPHNNILQVILETGLIGLILFLALIYKYLKQISNLTRQNNNCQNYQSISYACFINYYFIGMVSYSIWQVWWVAVGIWALILMKLLVKSDIIIDN